MSFPKIPDMNPCINITFDETINLLLASIAMEEMSLSKIIDAESQKLLFIIDDCIHKKAVPQDALDINDSVNSTIKNLIKLQMLLQFKLEDVKELIPSTTTTTTTTTCTTTTTTCTRTTTTKCTSSTTSHTTTCTTSTCSTTTNECECERECECQCEDHSMLGEGSGCISNPNDRFYCHEAALQILCLDRERMLRYIITNDDFVFFSMQSRDFDVERICDNLCRIYIHGTGEGTLFSKNKNNKGVVGFRLNMWEKEDKSYEVRMELSSFSNSALNHDSGLIKLNDREIPYLMK